MSAAIPSISACVSERVLSSTSWPARCPSIAVTLQVRAQSFHGGVRRAPATGRTAASCRARRLRGDSRSAGLAALRVHALYAQATARAARRLDPAADSCMASDRERWYEGTVRVAAQHHPLRGAIARDQGNCLTRRVRPLLLKPEVG